MRKELDRLGLAENTILIFMTDNGTARGAEVYNAGMRGWKGSPYEGGHRVPFFCYVPWMDAVRNFSLYGAMDVFPTLADLCSIDISHLNIDGSSMFDRFRDNADRCIILDNQQCSYSPEYLHHATVVMNGDWRLVKGRELYNIADDSSQKRNIADKHPELVEKMLSKYDEWFRYVYDRREYAPIHIGNPKEPVACLTAHDLACKGAWNQDEVMSGINCSGGWYIYVEKTGRYKISLSRYPREAKGGIVSSIEVPEGCRSFTYYKDLNNRSECIHQFEYALNNAQTRSIRATYAQLMIGDYMEKKDLSNPNPMSGDYTFNDNSEVCEVNFFPLLKKGLNYLTAEFIFDKGPGEHNSAYYVYIEKQ